MNNLLTQNLSAVAERRVLYAALLSPQGKVFADMLIWPWRDGVVLEVDPKRANELLRRLKAYKLRAEVEIEDATQALMILWSETQFPSASVDPRLPALGWRKLAARDPADPGGPDYDALRLAIGAPDLARDAEPEEVFAGEALLEELNGVDFHKGCFIGQENVSRMKRRATTRKKFCPLVAASGEIPPNRPVMAGISELGSTRTSIAGRAMALLRVDRALEALAAGETLTVDGASVDLDPPDWLILPQRPGADEA